jgi:hypothetical protein
VFAGGRAHARERAIHVRPKRAVVFRCPSENRRDRSWDALAGLPPSAGGLLQDPAAEAFGGRHRFSGCVVGSRDPRVARRRPIHTNDPRAMVFGAVHEADGTCGRPAQASWISGDGGRSRWSRRHDAAAVRRQDRQHRRSEQGTAGDLPAASRGSGAACRPGEDAGSRETAGRDHERTAPENLKGELENVKRHGEEATKCLISWRERRGSNPRPLA